MDTKHLCPSCQKPLAADVPLGLCPECLIKAGFPTAGTESGASTQGNFVTPSVDELAKLFPQLEIIELIGRGGMGAVYKARQKQLNRLVALKILPPGIGKEPAFAGRFTREARALAQLNHPGIVTLYEFGESGGQFFFLMEFVDGVNLRQLLATGRVSPREALAIVPQICDALQYAHDQGVIHRDIKPENILLDRRGRVKVADFGLAKIVTGGAGEGREAEPGSAAKMAETGSELTGSGKILGTPQYMSPEQREHPNDVDHRADIYALGVVFYQMLTGELPGKSIEPPSKKVQVDVRLDEIVLRALEKRPELRYQQASVLKTEVETMMETPPPTMVMPPQWRGHEYKSKRTLYGLPLVHVATGIDPQTGRPQHARGIIAIGQTATGLLAIGGRAYGGIAIGGIAGGVIAVGGLALGLISIGGMAIALLFAFGGMAAGGFAIGGMACGYFALGGEAFGVKTFDSTHHDLTQLQWLVRNSGSLGIVALFLVVLGFDWLMNQWRNFQETESNPAVKPRATMPANCPLSMEQWLALMDGGNYGESWDSAAELFRKQVSREEWVRRLEEKRRPLGEVRSRETIGLEETVVGTRYVGKFSASYENFPAASETVTYVREASGEWRPLGYLVRPQSEDAAAPSPRVAPSPTKEMIANTLDVLAAVATVALGWAAFEFGVFFNFLFVFILSMASVRVPAIVSRRYFKALELRLWKTPLARELRNHRRQLLNRWLFWILAALTVEICIVPAQFSPSEFGVIQVLLLGATGMLIISELFPAKRVRLGMNLAFAFGSLFILTQMVNIYWPEKPADGVVLSAPFRGDWLVVNGGPSSLVNLHYSYSNQRDALDMERVVNGRELTGPGNVLDSYPSWGETIYAPADGTVTEVENGVADNRMGETDREQPAGNHIVIDIGHARYVMMAHFQKGSVRPAVGEVVHVGDPIAKCGFSGNTSGPHLHIQVQNLPAFVGADPVTYPILFRDVTCLRRGQPRTDAPFAVRRNDVIVAGKSVENPNAAIRSDYIGQMYFPYGDSIDIASVERTKDTMIVRGRYDLVSQEHALLALYITATNESASKPNPRQHVEISRGSGGFELVHSNMFPGWPHVSMYADGHPIASIYLGTKEEADSSRKLKLGPEENGSDADPISLLAEQPPVVVETFPVSGARDVAPGETEIRVRFSKPMTDHSWSWATAWEKSTPEFMGDPYYAADGKTCAAKVKLEPGKTYAFWLNSDEFQNFKDVAGRPAVPYLLFFQTKPQ